MTLERFYGLTLSDKTPSFTWSSGEDVLSYKLIVKQVLLGHPAKDGEYNVIELETLTDIEPIKFPIAVLKTGETRYVKTDLEFVDSPVTFELTEGTGPVHIHATILAEYEEWEGAAEEEEYEDDDHERDNEESARQEKNKRKLSYNTEDSSINFGAKSKRKDL